MILNHDDTAIRTRPSPCCCICGAQGQPLYQKVSDSLFSVPGEWNLSKCPNNECGLIWLDPMPVEEDIGKAYREYFTHHQFAKKTVSWTLRLRQFLDNSYLSSRYGYHSVSAPWANIFGLIRGLSPRKRTALGFRVMFLPEHQGGKLLEVGCGSGDMLKVMQELGWHTEGVDFDPKAVENAQSKGLRVVHGTLKAQHYPDDYFDAVTMSHLIEHVPEPGQLLRECHRILKPGGRLVIATPNSDAWGHRLFASSWRGLEPPRHLHVFNRCSLTLLAQKAGFRIERLFTSINNASSIFLASRSIRLADKIGGNSQPWHIRRWGKAMMLAEWGILQISPFIGEEIVLMLEK